MSVDVVVVGGTIAVSVTVVVAVITVAVVLGVALVSSIVVIVPRRYRSKHIVLNISYKF